MTGQDVPASATPLRSRTAAIADLARSRQALLSVAQPALGALLALGRFPDPARITLGLLAATTGFLAVFSLNDVLDRGVDTESLRLGAEEAGGFDLDTITLRHPLAHGDLPMGLAIGWVGGLGAVSAVSAWLLAPACLALFGLAVALEVLYCSLSRVTWAKTFVSGAMVGVGGLAGWVAVAPLRPAAWWLFGFLAVWEIAGRNLPNDLSDITADARVGIRTVATCFGERVSAGATLTGAILLLVLLAAMPAPLPGRALSLAAGVWAVGIPAVDLAIRPTSDEAGPYFNRASLLPVLVLAAEAAVVLVGL